MKISYVPFANTHIMEFDIDDVKQVYYGQLNSCRCGCNGDYWTPEDAEFLEELQHALNVFKNANARKIRGEEWKDERYLEIEIDRYFCEEAIDEVEKGYAIYLKK